MARIEFDIETYKAHPDWKVETRDVRPARIICTDRKFGYPIIALAYNKDEDKEVYINADMNGKAQCSKSDDLFLVTPEPELTEMEVRLLSWLSSDTSGEIPMEKMKECIKARAKELLELARKELKDMIEFRGEEYQTGYKDGKAEALKDLPRWEKGLKPIDYPAFCIYAHYLFVGDKRISVPDLYKLPGFKKD